MFYFFMRSFIQLTRERLDALAQRHICSPTLAQYTFLVRLLAIDESAAPNHRASAVCQRQRGKAQALFVLMGGWIRARIRESGDRERPRIGRQRRSQRTAPLVSRRTKGRRSCCVWWWEGRLLRAAGKHKNTYLATVHGDNQATSTSLTTGEPSQMR